jgi:flagellar biosynthesis regulator FlaF
MNNSQIAHAFMNRQVIKSSNKNMYYDSDTLYSYGSHFHLAKFFEVGAKKYLFVNTNRYSNSTSKHQGHVRYAVNRSIVDQVFYIPFPENKIYNLDIAIPKIILSLLGSTKKCFNTQLKARSNDYQYQSAIDYLNTAHKVYIEFIDLFESSFIQTYLNLKDELIDLQSVVIQKLETINANKQAKKAKEAQTNGEKLERWIKHKFNGQIYGLNPALRLSKDKSHIETSHGAKVPLNEGIEALTDLRSGKDLIGRKIGGFTVNSVTLDFIVVGCHKISFESVNKFEEQFWGGN